MQRLTDERLAELDVDWHESEGTYLVAVVAELIEGLKVERARLNELTAETDELRIQLRTAQDAAVKFAHQRDALIGLVRSLSINPTIPDGIRSLMKSALPD